jgi:hypothetical protein
VARGRVGTRRARKTFWIHEFLGLLIRCRERRGTEKPDRRSAPLSRPWRLPLRHFFSCPYLMCSRIRKVPKLKARYRRIDCVRFVYHSRQMQTVFALEKRKSFKPSRTLYTAITPIIRNLALISDSNQQPNNSRRDAHEVGRTHKLMLDGRLTL